jgi:hypothetical protein
MSESVVCRYGCTDDCIYPRRFGELLLTGRAVLQKMIVTLALPVRNPRVCCQAFAIQRAKTATIGSRGKTSCLDVMVATVFGTDAVCPLLLRSRFWWAYLGGRIGHASPTYLECECVPDWPYRKDINGFPTRLPCCSKGGGVLLRGNFQAITAPTDCMDFFSGKETASCET